MSISYNAQINNIDKKYKIQFETDNYDDFKFVERACQQAIDKNDTAVSQKCCAQDRYIHDCTDSLKQRFSFRTGMLR